MGLLGDLFGIVDDIVSIPTDMIGLTNHHEKKEALERAKELYLMGEISSREYQQIKELLD